MLRFRDVFFPLLELLNSLGVGQRVASDREVKRTSFFACTLETAIIILPA